MWEFRSVCRLMFRKFPRVKANLYLPTYRDLKDTRVDPEISNLYPIYTEAKQSRQTSRLLQHPLLRCCLPPWPRPPPPGRSRSMSCGGCLYKHGGFVYFLFGSGLFACVWHIFFFGAFPTSIETQLPLICRHQRGRETDLMTSKLNKLNSDTVAKHPPASQPVRFDIASGGSRQMWVTRTNRNRLRQIRLFDWRGEKCGIDPKLRLEMACGKIDFLVLHRVLNDDSRKVGTIWYLRTASAAVALQLYHLSFVMS